MVIFGQKWSFFDIWGTGFLGFDLTPSLKVPVIRRVRIRIRGSILNHEKTPFLSFVTKNTNFWRKLVIFTEKLWKMMILSCFRNVLLSSQVSKTVKNLYFWSKTVFLMVCWLKMIIFDHFDPYLAVSRDSKFRSKPAFL